MGNTLAKVWIDGQGLHVKEDALIDDPAGLLGASSWDDMGKSVGKTKILDEISLSIVRDEKTGTYRYYYDTDCVITNYDKLWVVVNGVEHECNDPVTVRSGPGGNSVNVCFGNASMLFDSQEDTGETFMVGQGVGAQNICFMFSEEGEYTISLYAMGETVEPLPEEYMPLLTSPNGTKYKLTVADDGTLSAVAVTE